MSLAELVPCHPIVVTGTVAYDTIHTPHGTAEHVLGGSAVYFGMAAGLMTAVGLVAVVGEDFTRADRARLEARHIDLSGLQTLPGRTFSWHGRYDYDLSEAHTLTTHLNVLADFQPQVPPTYYDAGILFLANLDPRHQLAVLDSFPRKPPVVAADTMNYWIENARKDLERLLTRIDILIINEGEARQLAGKINIVAAARTIMQMGPFDLVIKRGGYGAILFHRDTIFAIPSYPLEEVVDTTGAGDSFAGGFLASLAREPTRIRKALLMGNLVASFTVEAFSVERLERLTRDDLKQRHLLFRDIVQIEDN